MNIPFYIKTTTKSAEVLLQFDIRLSDFAIEVPMFLNIPISDKIPISVESKWVH